jgi:hypothetical protein
VNAVENILQPDQLRTALAGFWNSALAIEPIRNGLAVALPQTGADGWQLVVEITEATPGTVRISDAGRTLGGLAALGQNFEATMVADHIESILRQSHMERDGMELLRWLPLPLDPVEVHVFAEALSAISHLCVLHEPTVRSQNVADLTLRKVFADRHITARAGVTLAGKTEKSVQVDYLVETFRPVAFEILRRRGRLLPVMEQWGYRWQDLQKVSPALMPVMLYDPAIQEIDEASRAIGDDVCSLFCAYDETDRIHGVLEAAASEHP